MKKKNFFLVILVLTLTGIFFVGCIPKKLVLTRVETVVLEDIDFGTEFKDLNLPKKVTVDLFNETQQEIPVTWNEDEYDCLTSGSQNITGELDLSDFDNLVNSNNLKAKATIHLLEEKFLLTIEIEGQGTVQKNPERTNYIFEEEIELVASTDNKSYKFVHWILPEELKLINDGKSTDDKIKFTMPKNEVEIKAIFNEILVGEKKNYTIDTVIFKMIQAPAATFPTEYNNAGRESIDRAYWIGETHVTYELWYAVRMWAIDEDRGDKKYTFANEGKEGSHGEIGEEPTSTKNEPVTMISFRDILIWTNALSEMLELDPVYRDKDTGEIIRESKGYGEDNAVLPCPTDNAEWTNNNGFRLPTEWEWELAARYIGPIKPTDGPNLKDDAVLVDGIWWTPGAYASGAYADINNAEETGAVAWYRDNSEGKTQEVGKKRANQLGLYDMSGNVEEYTHSFNESGNKVATNGGKWHLSLGNLQIHYRSWSFPPASTNYGTGLRLAGYLK